MPRMGGIRIIAKKMMTVGARGCLTKNASKEELIERISQYIDDMNKMPTLFKWKYKMDKMAGGIVVDKERGLLIC